jgi:hypothetical protein
VYSCSEKKKIRAGFNMSDRTIPLSVQNLLPSHLLSKNVKIRIYKTIILPVETCSLTLREEHRLRVFENRVLREIFVSKRNEVTGGWKDLIMRSFIACTLLQV